MRSPILFLYFCTVLCAQPQQLVNIDKDGVALQGYDPVAFFNSHAPTKGKKELESRYSGAKYLFANKHNLMIFQKNPERFAPAFGGYCAYGVLKGKLAEIDVKIFEIIDGRLVLQHSDGIREQFNQNQTENLLMADEQWAKMRARKR